MKILVITSNFPNKRHPYSGVFVQRTAREFARQGHTVTIIAPQKIRMSASEPFYENVDQLAVIRPRYFSFGAKKIFGYRFRRLTHEMFISAVLTTIKRLNQSYDVIYSHFLFPSGYAALKVGDNLGLSVSCCLGESNFDGYEFDYSTEEISSFLNHFDNVFPNNPDTMDLLACRYKISQNVKLVLNGVDSSVFYPKLKSSCRKKLGVSATDKIVIFVGGFIARKGPERVAAACNRLIEPPKQIYIGSGPLVQKGPDVIYNGVVLPELLPDYLSCADVFVLPSLSEGMPNALLEAMACNVPIVASNIPVHRFLLSDYPCAFLVDSSDPLALSNSINEALNSSYVQDFSSYDFNYSIKKRADLIIQGLSGKDFRGASNDFEGTAK